MKLWRALALVGVVLVAGCGANDQGSAREAKPTATKPTVTTPTVPKPTVRNPSALTEREILDALSVRASSDGRSLLTRSGCKIAAILTSKQRVDRSSDAGGTVVTTPDGSAGVKTTGDKPACRRELERGLASLKQP